MSNIDKLSRLDAYNDLIGPDKLTSRRASETFYDCPPQDVIANGVRDIRVVLDDVYDDMTAVDREDTSPQGFAYEEVCDQYWEAARRTPVEFAGTPESMEGYFEVLHFRQERLVRTNLRERFPEGSVPIVLLDAVELYDRELGTGIADSSRILNILLQGRLPALKDRASQLRDENQLGKTEATTEAFREFAQVVVPEHIALIREEVGEVFPLDARSKKIPYPPRPQATAVASDPLYLKEDEVEGFIRVYDLERRPITQAEMDLATTLMDSRQLRSSLLLFHMAIVDYSAQYFAEHPERLQHSLMSFNRFFVIDEEGDEPKFLPNPSLIATLSNNLAPAIAAVMLREGVSAEEFSSDHIQKGIAEVKDQHLFQSHIGKFNNLDSEMGTVELDGFFNQVCPATKVVMTGLTDWLPKMYDSCARS